MMLRSLLAASNLKSAFLALLILLLGGSFMYMLEAKREKAGPYGVCKTSSETERDLESAGYSPVEPSDLWHVKCPGCSAWFVTKHRSDIGFDALAFIRAGDLLCLEMSVNSNSISLENELLRQP